MDDNQFKIICGKLDRLFGIMAISSIKEKDDKIYALKKLKFTSAEIAPIVSMSESGIRDTKGWKKK